MIKILQNREVEELRNMACSGKKQSVVNGADVRGVREQELNCRTWDQCWKARSAKSGEALLKYGSIDR